MTQEEVKRVFGRFYGTEASGNIPGRLGVPPLFDLTSLMRIKVM